jgi:hypothetical protein
MNEFKGCWKIIVILYIFLLLIPGCVTQSPTKNVASSLLPIYTDPIGGFNTTMAMVDPIGTLETSYVFYTRNWGPGEVNYTVNLSYRDTLYPLDMTQLYIEPSHFLTEPNHSYISRVYLNISSLPKEFFTSVRTPEGGWAGYWPFLIVNVSSSGKNVTYGNDQILLNPIHHWLESNDYLISDNHTTVVRRGETGKINFSYQYNFDRGMEEINFAASTTPLDITITPSKFYIKHYLEFPVVVSISADPSLAPGEYPFEILYSGSNGDGGSSPVNVTVV